MKVDLNGKWIEIFRAGKYPQGTFTDADVKEIAESYSPDTHEAPNTLNHNDKGPAYGWVDKVKSQGGVLMAKLKQVPAEMNNLVSDGRYKKRSAEIYRNFNGTGKPYLRAVSFVSVPAVKGLKPAFAEFSDEKGDYETIEFEDKNPEPNTKGAGDMEKREIDQMFAKQNAAFDEKMNDQKVEFDEKMGEKDKVITKLTESLTATTTRLSETQAAQVSSSVDIFLEDMVKAFKITPAIKNSAKLVFMELAKVGGTIKFSETVKVDGKEVERETEKSPHQIFEDMIKSLPVLEFMEKEAVGKDGKKPGRGDVGKYDEGDEDAIAMLAEKAEEYIQAAEKAGKPITYGEANIKAEKALKGDK